MGGFYGSVQVRSGDRKAVIAAAEEVARENDIRVLVGPVINGWIGVYPENSGQDEGIGQALAEELGGVVLHALVHDDDVMAYWLWEEGEEVDSFFSTPGYFDEADQEAQEARAGDAKVLAKLLGGKAAAFAKLLKRGEKHFVMEFERLKQFGEAAGIANLVAAYEYLKSGETEEIQGWEEFVELPADEVEAERVEEKRRKKGEERAKRSLKERGILLVEEVNDRAMARACAAGEGFLVLWPQNELRHFKTPWEKPRRIEIEAGTVGLIGDQRGELVALEFQDRVEVRRFSSWEKIGELPGTNHSVNAFSADGRRLVHTSDEESVVSDLSGARVAAWKMPNPTTPTFHPDGRWLVVANEQYLAVMDLSEPLARPLVRFVGGRSTHAEQMALIDLDEMEREQRKGMEQTLEMMKKSGLPQAQYEQARLSIESQLANIRRSIQESNERNANGPAVGNESARALLFSRDGTTLWCGSDQGLRGYLWDEVLAAASRDMPAPRWKHDMAGSNEHGMSKGLVYALVQEPGSDAVLFGGTAGEVMRLDPSSGEVRTVLKLTKAPAILNLLFSKDGSALGVVSRPHDDSYKQELPNWVWQVWGYDKLV